MRIGTVTYHRSHNYGAFLQAYALVSFLREEVGVDAEIIDYNMKISKNNYIYQIFRPNVFKSLGGLKRYRMFNREVKKLPVSKGTLVSDSIEEFTGFVKDKYDIIITGSDEVWRIGNRGFPNPYWLSEDLGCKKIAYAVSSRSKFDKIDDEKKLLLKKLVSDFDYVGVRDTATYEMVLENISDEKKLHKNCDPVFLYDFKQNAEKGKRLLKEKFRIDTKKPTVGLMIGQKELGVNLAKNLKKLYKDKYNFVSLYFDHAGLPFCPGLTPFEWADVVAGLDFFVTTYFHGTCFAIKSNVPFFTVECRNGEGNTGKSYDLLGEMGLLDCYSTKGDSSLNEKITAAIEEKIGQKMDYELLCRKQKEKAESFVAVILREKEQTENERCN
ncbi:MAG: polysaccharide pyruvyl transferase family protein [Ruminococcaceae bacterium]|nr:polysaccharide pyruvyl transferase family protein [Oscillospiraceae bacterium]